MKKPSNYDWSSLVVLGAFVVIPILLVVWMLAREDEKERDKAEIWKEVIQEVKCD